MDTDLTKEVVDSIENVLRELKDFTGVVEGKGDKYYAKVYVRKGEIIGAYVKDEDYEYFGNHALYFLDRECKVVVHRQLVVIVPDEYKVEVADIKITAQLDSKLLNILDKVKASRGGK